MIVGSHQRGPGPGTRRRCGRFRRGCVGRVAGGWSAIVDLREVGSSSGECETRELVLRLAREKPALGYLASWGHALGAGLGLVLCFSLENPHRGFQLRAGSGWWERAEPTRRYR